MNIEPIKPLNLPFNTDDKIFRWCDEECENDCKIHEPYSYNDFINKINNFSGVNPDLIGENVR